MAPDTSWLSYYKYMIKMCEKAEYGGMNNQQAAAMFVMAQFKDNDTMMEKLLDKHECPTHEQFEEFLTKH